MIKTKEDMVKYVKEHNISEDRVRILAKNGEWLHNNVRACIINLGRLVEGKLYKVKWYINKCGAMAVDIFKKLTSIILQIPEELLDGSSEKNVKIEHNREDAVEIDLIWPDWVHSFEADKKDLFSKSSEEESLTQEQVDAIISTCRPFVDDFVKEQACLISRCTKEVLGIKTYVSDEPSFINERGIACYRVTSNKKELKLKPKSRREMLEDKVKSLFKKDTEADIFNRIV